MSSIVDFSHFENKKRPVLFKRLISMGVDNLSLVRTLILYILSVIGKDVFFFLKASLLQAECKPHCCGWVCGDSVKKVQMLPVPESSYQAEIQVSGGLMRAAYAPPALWQNAIAAMSCLSCESAIKEETWPGDKSQSCLWKQLEKWT